MVCHQFSTSPTSILTLAKSIQCPPPEDVPHTEIIGQKESYSVGEKITYKCSHTPDTRDRMCLTSGKWSPLPAVCSECEQGWKKYGDSCYFYSSEYINYYLATDKCTEMGATVATAKTQEEQDFLREVSKADYPYLWLGLNDDVVEGTWNWVDGEPLDGWTNWEAGEPNNWSGLQDCAVLTDYNLWNDLNCYRSYAVVCKKPKLDGWQVCRDALDTCVELFERTPQMCGQYPEFAHTYCLNTCGLCEQDSTDACNVENPNDHVVKVDNSVTSLPRGGVVEYRCETGYVVSSGDTHRGCLSTGSLSGQPLVCIALSQSQTVVNTHPFFYDGGLGFWGTSYTGANENFRIPRDGEVVRWEFYSIQEGQVAFQVWRHHPEVGPLEFEFIGQNIYQTPRDLEWKLEVPEAERIQVKEGDYIGIYIGYSAGRGGILYERCSDDPKAQGIAWRDYIYQPESLSRNTIYSFDPDVSCRYFTFRAIVGPSSSSTST